MTEDDELTPEEQAALRALPREADPPPALEERVVAALRARGLVGPRKSPWTGRLVRLAAGVALFAAGLGAGRATATRPARPGGPVFLLLLYAGPTGGDEAARVREYGAWAVSLRREGRLLSAERLGSEHRVLGEGGIESEASKAPRGYFLFRASGMDEALEIARTCPHLRHGGQVSVQPIDPV